MLTAHGDPRPLQGGGFAQAGAIQPIAEPLERALIIITASFIADISMVSMLSTHHG